MTAPWIVECPECGHDIASGPPCFKCSARHCICCKCEAPEPQFPKLEWKYGEDGNSIRTTADLNPYIDSVLHEFYGRLDELIAAGIITHLERDGHLAAHDAAIEAKVRADVAAEIRAEYLGPDAFKNPDGSEQLLQSQADAYDGGLQRAARIAEGNGHE